ncbi:unnamed protein product [Amoebophrya sp. A25]|nr:unnamed protein product [Amoebophrya sp. A25]|eukprot:GSA25T00015871001.1
MAGLRDYSRRLLVFLIQYRQNTVERLLIFFRAGRSAYIFISGTCLLVLAFFLLLAVTESKEAQAAPPGWESFVAATGTNQWVSCSFLLSAGCITMALNYLPRLEGEG